MSEPAPPLSRGITTSYGLDASLAHGCLVRAMWEFTDDGVGRLLGYRICHEWRLEQVQSITPARISQLAHSIIWGVDGIDVFPRVGADFDFDSVFFRGKAGPVMRVSFLIGAVYHGYINRGVVPVLLRPLDVRQRLGVKHTAKKEEVWASLAHLLPRTRPPGLTKDAWFDLQDALVLSYLVAAYPWKDRTP